jgi:hypothetical protein
MHRKALAFLVVLVLLVAQLSVFRFAYAVQHNFGYDSGTGSVQYTIGTGSGTTDKITGSVFTITENGTADSITVSLKRYASNGNEKGKCSIYKHSDLSSVGNTTEATKALTTTLAWYTFTFADPKPSLVANTAYVLVVWVDTTTYVYLGANSGAADQGHYQTVTYDGFPNPYVPTHVTYAFSIYCTYTISAGDTTKPTYSNVGTNTTVAGQPCNFSVTLADETALANYTFGTNNTGSWVNDTLVTISGTSYTANTTKTLNSTIGVVVQWEYWFADSSNNLNNTGIQSFTTVASYVETRYFRWDVESMNGVNMRKLFTANTSSSTSESHAKDGNVTSAGVTIGIRVWKRSVGGVDTEITNGTQVAQVLLNTSSFGIMVNATWTCPSTPLNVTDVIYVIVYGKFGTDAWAMFGSYKWGTAQLGATNLDAATWTVYYQIALYYSTDSNNTWHEFNFGSSSWNSRIENFCWTVAVSTVWHDVSTWTASLIVRTWSSGTSWSLTLLTSIWKDIATFGVNLVAMMWNDIATYTITLLSMAWHDLTWLFTLTPPQWLNVAVWTFSLLGDIDLISFALCFLALVFSIYPLVTGEEKALPALALVMAIVGCALSVLGLWYALAVAALSFILSIAALATRKD